MISIIQRTTPHRTILFFSKLLSVCPITPERFTVYFLQTRKFPCIYTTQPLTPDPLIPTNPYSIRVLPVVPEISIIARGCDSESHPAFSSVFL